MDFGRRTERRTTLSLGGLLVLALALGALVSCGGGSNPPATPEEADEVLVRVSGTEGTPYEGDYGSFATEPQTVNSTLGDDPTEYEVTIEEGVSDGVNAFFRKTESGPGELKAEIVADGEVVVESTTYAEFGSVVVEWLPDIALPDDLLEEDIPEETP